ncbi:hypothetical protein YC2023_017205 [Brassica napus]
MGLRKCVEEFEEMRGIAVKWEAPAAEQISALGLRARRKICFGLEPKQIFLPTKLTNTIKSHHRATSTKRFLEKQKEFTVKKLKRPNFVKKINSKTHLEYDQRIRAPPKELSFHAMKGNIIERETESPNCFPFCLK